MKKKYLITFSGGKDSLATIVWDMQNLPFDAWEVVFCDTGWEAQITYDYINWIEEVIGKKFIRLKTTLFETRIEEDVLAKIVEIFGERNVFAEMIINKQRFPSTKARFCTEFLKQRPMIDHVLSYECDIIVVQGVRAEESQARRNLKANDEYFKLYFEPYKVEADGRERFHTYRKDDIVTWTDKYTCDVLRPILGLTAAEVFDMIFSAGYKPNPLYFMGHSRVGCYPCIMCRLGEIKLIAEKDPKRIEQLYKLELLSGSTFFPPRYIPERHCTKIAMVKVYREDLVKFFGTAAKGSNSGVLFSDVSYEGETEELLYQKWFKNLNMTVYVDDDGDEYIERQMKVPSVMDVVKYVSVNPDQKNMFEGEEAGCISVYNICDNG